MIDESTELGARAARRLREEHVVWFTTVTPQEAPLPAPVWFLWEGGDSVVMYSRPGARVRNLEHNPRVTLAFPGGDADAGHVVITGRAAVDPDCPSGDRNAPYLAKYAHRLERLGMAPAEFARDYSQAVRITLGRVRAH
jgi:PPOX class probable F420-dependent enzyme